MAERGKQGRAQAVALPDHLHVAHVGLELQPLMGKGSVIDQAFGQRRTLRRNRVAPRGATEAQNRQRPERRFQRAELPLACGQRAGPQPGIFAMLHRPFSGGTVGGAQFRFGLAVGGNRHAVARLVQHDGLHGQQRPQLIADQMRGLFGGAGGPEARGKSGKTGIVARAAHGKGRSRPRARAPQAAR